MLTYGKAVLILRVATAVLTCLLLFRGSDITAQTQTLSPPPSQVLAVANAIQPTKTFPVFANGSLLTFPRTITAGRPDKNVVLRTLPGVTQQLIPFWLTNATSILVQDATVTPNNTIVAVGTYSKGDAANINFLSYIDSAAGNISATQDLGNYEASRVCSSADGTIWTLGQSLNPNGTASSASNLLNHYTASGVLKSSYISRSAFDNSVQFDFRPHGATVAHLSCGNASVGVYLAWWSPNTNQWNYRWTEVLYATGQVQSVTISGQGIPGGRVSGLALLDQGVVYSTYMATGSTLRGLYRLAINASSGVASWTTVSVGFGFNGSAANNYSELIGRDGAQLVIIRGSTTSLAASVLYWCQP